MGKRETKPAQGSSRWWRGRRRWLYATLALVVVAAFVGYYQLRSPAGEGLSFQVMGGETRPIIRPAGVSASTQASYLLAEQYGAVLDQLYCYCHCSHAPSYHKSLRSCFTDYHAAG